MDSQFLGMDRVITFEDANFFLPGDAFRWQWLDTRYIDNIACYT
jgi:hypothetical protein